MTRVANVEGLRVAIVGLRQAAETVRCAVTGFGPYSVRLGHLPESLWVVSARAESQLRGILASSRQRVLVQLTGVGTPGLSPADPAAALAVELAVVECYAQVPGYSANDRYEDLQLAAVMLSAAIELLRDSPVAGVRHLANEVASMAADVLAGAEGS